MITSTEIGAERLVKGPFEHPAMFYAGERDYLDGTLSFVRRGLHAGDPVAVAVPGPNLELLREALGRDAAAVHLVDMQVDGRNPGGILPKVLGAFVDAHPEARRVWIIGEPVWAGRSARERPACFQHEALINLAFAGRPVSILCPYDVDRLDRSALAYAAATHPVIRRAGREEISRTYAPRDVIDACNEPLPPPRSGAVTVFEFTAEDLNRARDLATERAAAHALTPDQVGAVELVVNELTVNSVRHGGGAGTLRSWAEDDAFVAEVSDGGHLTDVLAGRLQAGLGTDGRRGLLIAQCTSDLLRVHTTSAGTTIRAYFDLPTRKIAGRNT